MAWVSLLLPGTTQSFPRALPCVTAACQQDRKKKYCESWGWALWIDWRAVRKVSRFMQVCIFGGEGVDYFCFVFTLWSFQITHREGCRGRKNKREHLDFGKVARAYLEEKERNISGWVVLFTSLPCSFTAFPCPFTSFPCSFFCFAGSEKNKCNNQVSLPCLHLLQAVCQFVSNKKLSLQVSYFVLWMPHRCSNSNPSLLTFSICLDHLIYDFLKCLYPLGCTITWALAFSFSLNICLGVYFYIFCFSFIPLLRLFKFKVLQYISDFLSYEIQAIFPAAFSLKVSWPLKLQFRIRSSGISCFGRDAEVIFYPYLWHLGSLLLHVHWIRCSCWILIV